MTMPSGFSVTELNNAVVAGPVCESNATYWTANYNTPQDFHIEIDVPDTQPGVVYGLSQTLLLAVRTALYEDGKGRDRPGSEVIQIWRTPQPQTRAKFDFKGEWLDTENPDPANPNFPYYSNEAVGKTQLREGKDTCYVTLRMQKNPQVAVPTQIQKKNNKDEKYSIRQFDVQERYIITLFRDEDVKSGKPTPLLQWEWAYKHAWYAAKGKPVFEQHPSFVRKCMQMHNFIDKWTVQGPVLEAGKHDDHFRPIDTSLGRIDIGEVDDWRHEITDEWEACDA